jgi:16S rRNA (guanine966-N2)-methyltransferase
LRVIAGSAKGKRLKAPRGLATRPITDMIKGALFNVWGARVIAAEILDLFAGSGGVGIEALSRGAKRAVFVDNSPQAVGIIRENLANCHFSEGNPIIRGDVLRVLPQLDRRGNSFDLIYIDPPFTQEALFIPVMSALAATGLVKPEAIVVIRTPRRREMPDFGNLCQYRHTDYGESSLHYYCRQEGEPRDDGDFPDFR